VEKSRKYVNLVTQHRGLLCGEVLPWNPSCGKLDLKVLGNLDVEAVDSDGTARVVGIVYCSGVLKAALYEQWSILAEDLREETQETEADKE